MSRHNCKGRQPQCQYYQDNSFPKKCPSSKEMKETITKSCVKMCSRDIRSVEVVAGEGYLDL